MKKTQFENIIKIDNNLFITQNNHIQNLIEISTNKIIDTATKITFFNNNTYLLYDNNEYIIKQYPSLKTILKSKNITIIDSNNNDIVFTFKDNNTNKLYINEEVFEFENVEKFENYINDFYFVVYNKETQEYILKYKTKEIKRSKEEIIIGNEDFTINYIKDKDKYVLETISYRKAIKKYIFKNGFLKIIDLENRCYLYNNGIFILEANKIKIFNKYIMIQENNLFSLYNLFLDIVIENKENLFILKNENFCIYKEENSFVVYDLINNSVIEESDVEYKIFDENLLFFADKKFFIIDLTNKKIFNLISEPLYFQIINSDIFYICKNDDKEMLYHNNKLINSSEKIEILNIEPLVYTAEEHFNKKLIIGDKEIIYTNKVSKLNSNHYLKKDNHTSTLLNDKIKSLIENIDSKHIVVIENNFVIIKLTTMEQNIYDINGKWLLTGNNINTLSNKMFYFSDNNHYFLIEI